MSQPKISPAVLLTQTLIHVMSLARPDTMNYDPSTYDIAHPLWPCFTGAMPDGDQVPHEAVCVYDTTPVPQGRGMHTLKVFQRYGFQIKVRSRGYEKGWMQTCAIVDVLDAVRNLKLVNPDDNISYFIPSIERMGIMPIGMDDAKLRRNHFTINGTFCCEAYASNPPLAFQTINLDTGLAV